MEVINTFLSNCSNNLSQGFTLTRSYLSLLLTGRRLQFESCEIVEKFLIAGLPITLNWKAKNFYKVTIENFRTTVLFGNRHVFIMPQYAFKLRVTFYGVGSKQQVEISIPAPATYVPKQRHKPPLVHLFGSALSIKKELHSNVWLQKNNYDEGTLKLKIPPPSLKYNESELNLRNIAGSGDEVYNRIERLNPVKKIESIVGAAVNDDVLSKELVKAAQHHEMEFENLSKSIFK